MTTVTVGRRLTMANRLSTWAVNCWWAKSGTSSSNTPEQASAMKFSRTDVITRLADWRVTRWESKTAF